MAVETIRTIGIKLDPNPMTRGVAKVRQQLRGMGQTATQETRNMSRESQRSSNSIVRAFGSIGGSIRTAFSSKPVVAFFAAVHSGADRAKRAVSGLLGILKNPIFLGATGLGAVFGVKSSLDAAGDLKKVGITLAAVSDDAGGDMAFLRQQADRLGVSLIDNADAYSKFTAAGNVAGLSGQQLKEVFLGVAEAGAVFGLTAEQQVGALKALEQMLSKGTVQAEELRGQLGERIPGAFVMAAKAMGKTTAELGKMLEQGEVLATDLLPRLAAEMRRMAATGLESSLHTLSKEVQRFKNAFFEARAQFGQPVADVLAPIVADHTARLEQRVGEGDFTRLGEFFARGIELANTAVGQLKSLLDPALGIVRELAKLAWFTAKGFFEWGKALVESGAFQAILEGMRIGLEAVLGVIQGFGAQIKENFDSASFVAIGAALGITASFLLTNASLATAFFTAVNLVVFGIEILFAIINTVGPVVLLKFTAITAGVFLLKDAVMTVIGFVKDFGVSVWEAAKQFGLMEEVKGVIGEVSLTVQNLIGHFTQIKINGLSAFQLLAVAAGGLIVVIVKAIRAAVTIISVITEVSLRWGQALGDMITNVIKLETSLIGAGSTARGALSAISFGLSETILNWVKFDATVEAHQKTLGETASFAQTLGGIYEQTGTAGKLAMETVDSATGPVSDSLSGLIAQLEAFVGSAKSLKSAFGASNPSLASAYLGDGGGIADTAMSRKALGIQKIAASLGGLKPPSAFSGGGGKAKGGGGGGGRSEGPRTVKAKVRPLGEVAEEEFKFESFIGNLDRVRAAMEGAYNPQIMQTAREELEILDRVMRDKVFEGTVKTTDAFKFGLIDAVRQLGSASQQAFEMAGQSFDVVGNGISDGLNDMIAGTKSVTDAFKDMTVSILRDLAAMIIRQLVFNSLAGIINSAVPGAGTALLGGVQAVSTNATGRQVPGQGGATQDLSKGLRGRQELAIVEGNEVILRPQDLNTLSRQQSSGGGNVVYVNTNVTVNSDGTTEKDTSTSGSGKGEQIARMISATVDARINEMMVTPGAPLYQG